MFDTFGELEKHLDTLSPVRTYGEVVSISGLVLKCRGLRTPTIGQRVLIETATGESRPADVVGVEETTVTLMPFGSMEGIGPKCKVYETQGGASLLVNDGYIGRVINALGEPVDNKGALPVGGAAMALKSRAPAASERKAVGAMMDTGVNTMNTFLPLCRGQRMGIFAGSGVGKSVLMSMIARYSEADVNVIGLIGERGREVREFIEDQLGKEGLARSVVVVATGDESPMMRRQAAYTTMAVAEYFRNQGKQVMLFMDSVTRFAMAQREIGLSIGEPPTTRGYTPSVFSELPQVLERAGPGINEGAITAIFTVLVEGGDMDEPVADAVRGIVDGHIVLERRLAERGHFPAINVLRSISRMAPECYTPQQWQWVRTARALLATYDDMEELIRLGAYKTGSDPSVDRAIQYHEPLVDFLQQAPGDVSHLEESFAELHQIVAPLADERV